MAAPMFTDFNILCEKNPNKNTLSVLPEVIDNAVILGYERLAFNNVVDFGEGGKGKKHKEKMNITPPSEFLLNDKSMSSMKLKCRSFEQLSRITAVLKDASNTHKLSSPEIQAYDILAVQPTNEKTFQMACTTLEVDIITIDFSETLDFPLKRPMVRLAAERGIHFEVIYSPALHDNSVKRNILSNAMQLVSAGGGRNVIISSGAQKAFDLRSPYDVINLASFLGLKPSQAKDAVCRNCRAVLKHAESRKTCKSVISVQKLSSLPAKESHFIESQEAAFKKSGVTSLDCEEEDSEEEESDDDEEEEWEEDDPPSKKPKL